MTACNRKMLKLYINMSDSLCERQRLCVLVQALLLVRNGKCTIGYNRLCIFYRINVL